MNTKFLAFALGFFCVRGALAMETSPDNLQEKNIINFDVVYPASPYEEAAVESLAGLRSWPDPEVYDSDEMGSPGVSTDDGVDEDFVIEVTRQSKSKKKLTQYKKQRNRRGIKSAAQKEVDSYKSTRKSPRKQVEKKVVYRQHFHAPDHRGNSFSKHSRNTVKRWIRALYTKRQTKNFHGVVVDILAFGTDNRRKLLKTLLGRTNDKLAKDINTVSFTQKDLVVDYWYKTRKKQLPIANGSKFLHLLANQALREAFDKATKIPGVKHDVKNGQGQTVKQFCNKYKLLTFSSFLKK